MVEFASRFQIKGRIFDRGSYRKRENGKEVGPERYFIKIVFEGGTLDLGQDAGKFMDNCPLPGEECLVQGVLLPSRQLEFGRPLYSLQVQSLGALSAAPRKSAG